MGSSRRRPIPAEHGSDFPPAIDSAQRDVPAGYGTDGVTRSLVGAARAPDIAMRARGRLFSPAPCDRLRALHAEQEEQRAQLGLVRVGEAPHARRGAGARVLLRRRRRGGAADQQGEQRQNEEGSGHGGPSYQPADATRLPPALTPPRRRAAPPPPEGPRAPPLRGAPPPAPGGLRAGPAAAGPP